MPHIRTYAYAAVTREEFDHGRSQRCQGMIHGVYIAVACLDALLNFIHSKISSVHVGVLTGLSRKSLKLEVRS